MQIFRVPYPIRDYLTDMKIVLENVVRMLHCMVDISGEKIIIENTQQHNINIVNVVSR